MIRFPHLLLSIIIFSVATASCKKEQEASVSGTESENHYSSIKKIGYNEFLRFKGRPFILSKIITLNGKTDSLMFNCYNADWGSIMETFFATDISDKKYKDMYDVSVFDEPASWSKVLYYVAKDKKMFMQTMQLRFDPETRELKGIYIETAKNSFWNHNTQKLYYVPYKLIMIQETDNPLVGETKELKIEYHLPNFYNSTSQS